MGMGVGGKGLRPLNKDIVDIDMTKQAIGFDVSGFMTVKYSGNPFVMLWILACACAFISGIAARFSILSGSGW